MILMQIISVMIMETIRADAAKSADIFRKAVFSIYISVLLLYMEMRPSAYIPLLEILILSMIPAFGEILHLTSARRSARPPLSAVTAAWGICAVRR